MKIIVLKYPRRKKISQANFIYYNLFKTDLKSAKWRIQFFLFQNVFLFVKFADEVKQKGTLMQVILILGDIQHIFLQKNSNLSLKTTLNY